PRRGKDSAIPGPGSRAKVRPTWLYPRLTARVGVPYDRTGSGIGDGGTRDGRPRRRRGRARRSSDARRGRDDERADDGNTGATERRYLRIHMLHRVLEIHERYLLHPRVLDVLEALIGPDVMAMQTMLFIKPPGGAGQGYHQDSYYIPTVPDTLCGAWLAIDRADEENGCMWFTPGTQHEPIYPTAGREHANHGDALGDLPVVENLSHTDERVNTLARVAAKYPEREVPGGMD